MNVVLSVPTVAQRGGLFGLVVSAHVALFMVLALAKSSVPVIEERTIVVDMLPIAAVGTEAKSPQPSAVRPAVAAPATKPVQERSRPVQIPASIVKPVVPQPEIATDAAPIPSAVSSSAPASSWPENTRQAGAVGGKTAGGSPGAGAVNGGASGDSVSQARFDADYLRNPAPPYPAISRRMGEEGKVILRVLVTPEGTPATVEVRTSSGSQRLDESAMRTVRQWKFVPARRGDMAEQSWVLVPVIFKLEQ